MSKSRNQKPLRKLRAATVVSGDPAINLLLIGRWHGVTRDQRQSLRRCILAAEKTHGQGKLVFVITGAEQGGTKRHPLFLAERKRIVEGLAQSLGRPYEVHSADDISDSQQWTTHVIDVVRKDSGGRTDLTAANTVLVSANPDVNKQFDKQGFRFVSPATGGSMPADLLARMATGLDWKRLATRSTVCVLESGGIVPRVVNLFRNVLLNEDGELSHGRDFSVYSAGMDASIAVKIADICSWVRGGRIVDKGCGTGSLLIHLSQLFPNSEIIGMDLSRELLHRSESQHYPNHNVAVVKGNIIHQRFADGSLSTVIFSSVIHEVFSYNGYDKDQVRLALKNTRRELAPLGRLIIRDGISPGAGHVWMRCDEETVGRFRRFAREFKNKSAQPGVPFEEQVFDGQTWFRLSLHDANEFLSKKDYLTNWDMEVNEEFGVFTLDQWRSELTASGYRVIECSSYVNPWIKENRYDNRVWLHADGAVPGAPVDFPDTTCVIVAEAC